MKTELLRRMGCELAFRWLRQNQLSMEDDFVLSKMQEESFCARYPNPADRFIATVKLYKAYLKANMPEDRAGKLKEQA